MQQQMRMPLASLTTLRLGGPAAILVEAGTTRELVQAVRSADAERIPVLLVGGGSNLVISDHGWPGHAVLIRSRGIHVSMRDDDVYLDVAAGEPWDELVARCVSHGWAGIECLSGIPGLVGAVPVQNVGAYGQEIAERIVSVRVWDREYGDHRKLTRAECGFAYRNSIFKHSSRYVVLSVLLRLHQSQYSTSIRYTELARALGCEIGEQCELNVVRSAVLELRQRKGMVLDQDDHDTWSAGSFFLNPVLSREELLRFESYANSRDYPHWPAPAGHTKLSAAWLIEQAGFRKGHPFSDCQVGLSTKHTLALINRGNAKTTELIALARDVRNGVYNQFGVILSLEPKLVGISL